MGSEMFACGACNSFFDSDKKLVTHVISHSEGKPLNCLFSPRSIADDSQGIVAEIRNHCGLKLFRCTISPKAMKKQVKFLCKECNLTFTSERELQNHFLEIHVEVLEKLMSCNNCSKYFHRMEDLETHTATCGADGSQEVVVADSDAANLLTGNMFGCGQCSEMFESADDLVAHSKVHEISKKCDVCDKVFQRLSDLKKHQKKCYEENSDRASGRGIKPRTSVTLSKGNKDYDAAQNEDQGDEDDGGQTRRSLRKRPADAGDGESPKQVKLNSPDNSPEKGVVVLQAANASTQGDGSSRKVYIKLPGKDISADPTQLSMHNGDKIIVQQAGIQEKIVVQTTSAQPTAMIRQAVSPATAYRVVRPTQQAVAVPVQKTVIRQQGAVTVKNVRPGAQTASRSVEADIRPDVSKALTCGTCGKACDSIIMLTMHLNIHGNDAKFVCGLCKKKFPRSCHLTRHIRTHTDQKNVSCDFCNEMFSGYPALKRHMRVHEDDDDEEVEEDGYVQL